MQKIGTLLLCALPIALSACGGKSGGDTAQSRQQDMEAAQQETARRIAATQHLDYPVKQAMQAILTRDEKLIKCMEGEVEISNQNAEKIGGVVELHTTAMAPTTYEGAPAEHNTFKLSGPLKVPGTSRDIPMNISFTDYYGANLDFLGFNSSTVYCAAAKSPGYPVSLKIGARGSIASFDCYSDATKSVHTGHAEIGYLTHPGKDDAMLFWEYRKYQPDHDKHTYEVSRIFKIKTNGHISLAGMSVLTSGGADKMNVGSLAE